MGKMLYTIEEIEEIQKNKQKISKRIRIIIYVILIPILLCNIVLIAQSVLHPKETPSLVGIKSYVIISGSMQPELNIGDIVIVKKEDNLQKGDIISFRQGQSVITHRINNIINENGNITYQTKGDNNNIEDSGTITDSVIEGKVVLRIPKLGKLSIFMQNKILLVIIVLLLYVYISFSRLKEKRRKERKTVRKQYEKMKMEEDKCKESSR